MRATTVIVTVLAVLAGWIGCQAHRYSVTLRLDDEDLRGTIVGIELFVVESCGSLDSTGADPAAPIQSVFFRTDAVAPSLRPVSSGQYGLYGRGRDASCAVVAAGCVDVQLENGGEGSLLVPMSRVSGPGCDDAELCASGVCVQNGADGDADADTQSDADTDMETLLHEGGHLNSPGVTEADIYVDAASGSDARSGASISEAVATMARAMDIASEGVTIAVLDGTYYDIEIGVPGVTVSNLAGHQPVVTAQGEGPDPTGILVRADGVTVQGFEVRDCVLFGVSVHRAADTVVRYITAHNNGEAGLSTFEATRPLFERCVAFLNYDPASHGEHGNGMAMRFETSDGVIRHSVSFDNSSSGFSGHRAIRLTIEDSVAFGNGYDRWSAPAFNGWGAGFSVGGSDSTLRRVISYGNRGQGINTDGGDNVTIEWCSIHNNHSVGIEIRADSEHALVRNSISFGHVEELRDAGTGTSAHHNSWQSFSVDQGDFQGVTSPLSGEYQQAGFAAIEQSTYLRLAVDTDLRGASSDGSDLGAFQADRQD